MNEYDIKRLALIFSVQTEVEAMKTENKARELQDLAQAFPSEMFQEKANELQNLAYCPNCAL